MKNSEVHLNNESAEIGKEIIPASHSESKEVIENYHRNRKSVTETVVEENVLKNSSRDTNEANENVENHSAEESEYSKSEIEDKTETVNDDKINSQTNTNGNEEDHKLLPETDIKAAENEDGKIDDKMNGVPIDRGWAWAVLTGDIISTAISVSTNGLSLCSE